MTEFKIWNGNIENYINKISISNYQKVVIGNFGGSSSQGTLKNEDGYMLMITDENKVLSIIFDAHATNESILLLQNVIKEKTAEICKIIDQEVCYAIPQIQKFFIELLTSSEIATQFTQCCGETAVLVVFQMKEYLWWLSIGDNSLYIFHKEFNELGQYSVNSRTFYQWAGQCNSLNLEVPCYSTGTIELREGLNKIVMLTDGILEIKDRPFENNNTLEVVINAANMNASFNTVLQTVKNSDGRDNATIIGWEQRCEHKALRPTRIV